jgi:hypothetical protein
MSNNLYISRSPQLKSSGANWGRLLRNKNIAIIFIFVFFIWVSIWNFKSSDKVDLLRKLQDELKFAQQREDALKSELQNLKSTNEHFKQGQVNIVSSWFINNFCRPC